MAIAPNRKVFEAAAGWYVQFQADPPTLAEQKAWRLWIDSDPAHLAAWNQMEQLQRSLGALPQDVTRRALSTTQQRRQVLKWMLALGSTGYLGWNVQQHTPLGNVWADYRTAVGQRRRIELADGTQIDLNTGTAIDVAFDGRQRLIRLREGEVLIHTGKLGGQTPFYVDTRQGRVQALGTRFSVRQLGDETLLAVYEGAVQVNPECASVAPGENIIRAGQQVRFSRERLGSIEAVRETTLAWRSGLLVADDMPLGEWAQALMRYTHQRLEYAPALGELRVSGTFPLDDLPLALAMLAKTYTLQVHEADRQVFISR